MALIHVRPDIIYHGLHIAIADGWVYSDYDRNGPKGAPIGKLKGARISSRELQSTNHRRTSGQRAVDTFNAVTILGPLGFLAGLSGKEERGQITIHFTNGNVLNRTRIGPLLRQALKDADRFHDRERLAPVS